ncbi:MAG TPA: metallophosphoesterase [Thermoanaerobaculia bacterium]|nr:metallophosphoesterase [Thermoanaerobaculia bacterium]
MTRFPQPWPAPAGVAVFADAHLGQVEGDADDLLAALEGARSRGLSTAVLLGDIFHYFIGHPKLETPFLRRALDGFAALASRGLSLRYVEGNRDFFVAGSRYAEPFATYRLADGLLVGGVRFAFVHGDRVNTADLPYRFWRRVSKNPVARAALEVIPGPLARAIVARTEARLYRSNFRHKKRLPESALRAEGRQARAQGYDALLVGHFHVARTFREPGGVTHVLPAWLEERKHAEISATGELSIVQEATVERARRRGFGALVAEPASAAS